MFRPNIKRIEPTLSDPYNREQTEAIRAVRKAARLCRAVGSRIRPEILDKKDKSPVTVADFGSQALICRALAEAFPIDPIIAEEDSAELRQAGNAVLLGKVVEHVRAIEPGSDPLAEDVCGWIDRARRASIATGSGPSIPLMGQRDSSEASSTPWHWLLSSMAMSWWPVWRART